MAIHQCVDNKWCEGKWENDHSCGNGYEVYVNDNNYIGEFKEDKAKRAKEKHKNLFIINSNINIMI